ncbi:MAG TPA: hypothetical protein VKR06_46650, partial [Ktedonosporobacter sp.]|nr:hypothetical protein [Ktedonosporobacter sp.]
MKKKLISSLDFFPHMGMIEPYVFRHPEYPESAFWQVLVTTELLAASAPQVTELQEDGWQPIADVSTEERVCMLSQLSNFLDVSRLSGDNTIEISTNAKRHPAIYHTPNETWIKTEDLEHAREYPVLLCFESPLATEEDAHTYLEQMTIGSEALVFYHGKAYRYRYHDLDSNAAGLNLSVQGGIDAFCSFTKPLYAWDQTATPSEPLSSFERKNWEKRRMAAEEHWAQTHQAAKQLAKHYWLYHLQRQRQLALSVPPPAQKSAFKERTVALIPASLALRGALAAYSNAQSQAGNAWQPQENRLVYRYQHARDEAQIEWRPADTATLLHLESLWKKIRALDDHDGDVLLCLLAHWIEGKKDPEGYIWISAENMLSYRGLQPRSSVGSDGTKRSGGYRQDDLTAISHSVEHIRNTHVTLHQWTQQQQPKRRGRPRKHVIGLESYLISITDFLQQHTLL